MNLDEALQHCTTLRSLLGDYPGANASALEQARRIEFAFDADIAADAYVREKVRAFVNGLENWCSASKWRKWGADPANLKQIQLNNLAKLRSAIQTCYSRSMDQA